MSDGLNFAGEILWRPDSDYVDRANLTQFMHQHKMAAFPELMQRSIEDVPWFTSEVLKFLDIQFKKPFSNILDLSDGIQWPHWCVDGRMNIVQNCLDKYQNTPIAQETAVIWEAEEGGTRSLTYQELYREVNRAANALRSLGLGKGSPVGIYMPMIPEIVVSLLAVAKIGGIILPLFSGYGVEALKTRLHDAEAEAVFTADGFYRRGTPVEMKPILDEAAAEVASIKQMIVFRRIGVTTPMRRGRDHWWHELVDTQADDAATEDTSAEDTLMVIYTSGTTGRPKGAVHTHCGFPIKAAQDMAFGTDLHRGQVIYWITDMGWMMGPWLVFGALIQGGTFFIYDGAPDYPGPDRLWSMVERHRITTLGVSPTLIRALSPLGEQYFRKHDLSSLRFFASTGEPWNPEPWRWLFERVGEGKRPIINYSGGTEISGGILMGNPILPLKATAFSGPCPGIAADVFDENGQPVRDKVGELVIKAPWIGMTRGFWKDPGRYLETYWSRWENVWVHGDFAAVDRDGMWYILGRSDDTIKIAGKRLGPAEVESVAVKNPAVVEAAAIGVPHPIKGSDLVLFCVLAADQEPSDSLADGLKSEVARALGKPLKPRQVIFISDLPKTRNAKVMRRMVRAAYLDQEAGDTSSLVNPESVEEIRQQVRGSSSSPGKEEK
jgi:acetyl-CoA synthetase